MIKVSKDVLISKIKEKSGISDKELQSKVKDKLDQLSGLISEEGALHIIANELGVKIMEDPGKLQIKNVMAGMRNVELNGKVIKKYEIRNFETEKRKGKVGSFLIGDETGIIRVVAWNDKADILDKLKEQDILKIENGYARENRGRLEVHLGDKTTITISPKDVKDIEVNDRNVRKQIKDLQENENNVEILGTIVQVFDPRFFEVCPECGKRVKENNGVFLCNDHKEVTPGYSYVVNLFLDDGTENVRVVLWRNQTQNLFGMNDNEIVSKKDTGFEEQKNELLGKIVKFVGRTNKNEMFDRIEFIPQLVFMNPDPEEEIKRLNEEISVNKDKTEESPNEEDEEINIKPSQPEKVLKEDDTETVEQDDSEDETVETEKISFDSDEESTDEEDEFEDIDELTDLENL